MTNFINFNPAEQVIIRGTELQLPCSVYPCQSFLTFDGTTAYQPYDEAIIETPTGGFINIPKPANFNNHQVVNIDPSSKVPGDLKDNLFSLLYSTNVAYPFEIIKNPNGGPPIYRPMDVMQEVINPDDSKSYYMAPKPDMSIAWDVVNDGVAFEPHIEINRKEYNKRFNVLVPPKSNPVDQTAASVSTSLGAPPTFDHSWHEHNSSNAQTTITTATATASTSSEEPPHFDADNHIITTAEAINKQIKKAIIIRQLDLLETTINKKIKEAEANANKPRFEVRNESTLTMADVYAAMKIPFSQNSSVSLTGISTVSTSTVSSTIVASDTKSAAAGIVSKPGDAEALSSERIQRFVARARKMMDMAPQRFAASRKVVVQYFLSVITALPGSGTLLEAQKKIVEDACQQLENANSKDTFLILCNELEKKLQEIAGAQQASTKKPDERVSENMAISQKCIDTYTPIRVSAKAGDFEPFPFHVLENMHFLGLGIIESATQNKRGAFYKFRKLLYMHKPNASASIKSNEIIGNIPVLSWTTDQQVFNGHNEMFEKLFQEMFEFELTKHPFTAGEQAEKEAAKKVKDLESLESRIYQSNSPLDFFGNFGSFLIKMRQDNKPHFSTALLRKLDNMFAKFWGFEFDTSWCRYFKQVVETIEHDAKYHYGNDAQTELIKKAVKDFETAKELITYKSIWTKLIQDLSRISDSLEQPKTAAAAVVQTATAVASNVVFVTPIIAVPVQPMVATTIAVANTTLPAASESSYLPLYTDEQLKSREARGGIPKYRFQQYPEKGDAKPFSASSIASWNFGTQKDMLFASWSGHMDHELQMRPSDSDNILRKYRARIVESLNEQIKQKTNEDGIELNKQKNLMFQACWNINKAQLTRDNLINACQELKQKLFELALAYEDKTLPPSAPRFTVQQLIKYEEDLFKREYEYKVYPPQGNEDPWGSNYINSWWSPDPDDNMTSSIDMYFNKLDQELQSAADRDGILRKYRAEIVDFLNSRVQQQDKQDGVVLNKQKNLVLASCVKLNQVALTRDNLKNECDQLKQKLLQPYTSDGSDLYVTKWISSKRIEVVQESVTKIMESLSENFEEARAIVVGYLRSWMAGFPDSRFTYLQEQREVLRKACNRLADRSDLEAFNTCLSDDLFKVLHETARPLQKFRPINYTSRIIPVPVALQNKKSQMERMERKRDLCLKHIDDYKPKSASGNDVEPFPLSLLVELDYLTRGILETYSKNLKDVKSAYVAVLERLAKKCSAQSTKTIEAGIKEASVSSCAPNQENLFKRNELFKALFKERAEFELAKALPAKPATQQPPAVSTSTITSSTAASSAASVTTTQTQSKYTPFVTTPTVVSKNDFVQSCANPISADEHQAMLKELGIDTTIVDDEPVENNTTPVANNTSIVSPAPIVVVTAPITTYVPYVAVPVAYVTTASSAASVSTAQVLNPTQSTSTHYTDSGPVSTADTAAIRAFLQANCKNDDSATETAPASAASASVSVPAQTTAVAAPTTIVTASSAPTSATTGDKKLNTLEEYTKAIEAIIKKMPENSVITQDVIDELNPLIEELEHKEGSFGGKVHLAMRRLFQSRLLRNKYPADVKSKMLTCQKVQLEILGKLNLDKSKGDVNWLDKSGDIAAAYQDTQ